MRPNLFLPSQLLLAMLVVDAAVVAYCAKAPNDATYVLLLALGHAQVAVWITWLLFARTPWAWLLTLFGLAGVQSQLVADPAGFAGVLFVLLLLKARVRHHTWQIDRATASPLDHSRQFSLQDLMIWMTTAGVALALLNCLRADGGDVRALLVATTCSMLTALLITTAVLDERLSLQKLAGSIAVALSIVASLTIDLPAINRWLWIERAVIECILLLAGMSVLRISGLRIWPVSADALPQSEASPSVNPCGARSATLTESRA